MSLSKRKLAGLLFVILITTNGCDNSSDDGSGSDDLNRVKTPVFSAVDADIIYGETVSLKTETKGAEIYYTIDESVPTTNSLKYDDHVKIEVTKKMLVKAIAVKKGMKILKLFPLSYTRN